MKVSSSVVIGICILFLGLFLAACDVSHDTVSIKKIAPLQAGQSVIEKSAVSKGAGVQLNYITHDDVVVGEEVRVIVDFTAPSNHQLHVYFSVEDGLELVTDARNNLFTNHKGRAGTELVFIPLSEGKFHIRVFTQLLVAGDSIPQVLSIPVYVGDKGKSLTQDKPSSEKIDLPASRF